MGQGTTGHEATASQYVPVCGIGASAGGLAAVQGLFRHIPPDLGLAYVIIMHLAPDEPSALADIVAGCTRMPVHQVKQDLVLEANAVYVISPDRELFIDGDSISARPFSEPRWQRAPIDMFFRSVAAARGDGIAMVLSGAGSDGSLGIRAVKEGGGIIMAQETAEAGFPEMPQSAIASGVVDFVAPLARLAERVAEAARSKDAVRSLDEDGDANDLRRIVAFLRTRTGYDFSGYKRATIMRRVLRRIQLCRAETLDAYVAYLFDHPEEANALLSDFLISVTMFFRDPHAFDALAQTVIKPLFDELNPEKEEAIRAWVVGCATGEEAYSIAILLHEESARRKVYPEFQIFATDLDETALAKAREGRYPRSIEADVSQERLTRFFIDEGTHFRVRKELRESILFAKHSVIKEPPFMRLDLITCRNLLIYMERSLQQQICSIFHYGLKPGRYLFLGSAETADTASDLFATIDRDARLYCARRHALHGLPVFPQFSAPERHQPADQSVTSRFRSEDLPGVLHVSALEERAPASVLVDDLQNILHLSQSAGRFILHSGGSLSHSLPAVVRPELRLDLRLALSKALEQKEPSLSYPLLVAFEGEKRRVGIQVTPVPSKPHVGARALVFFLDGGRAISNGATDASLDTRPDEVRRLHAELKAAQEALIASRRDQEVSVQDLQATNEELQSTNEEYRSTAEELETSKEELQSINEELHTVNAELKSKLASISVAHSDLQNLTSATEIGTMFLDADQRIKMFTPPIAELFNITRNDIGRLITDFTHHLDYDKIDDDARAVLRNLTPIEKEVQSRGERWYSMRLRPYRTVEDRIDGTVVTFVDISARRNAQTALIRSEQQFWALLQASSQALYRMSPDWTEMRELSGGAFLSDTDRPNSQWLDKYIPVENQPEVLAQIHAAREAKGIFDLEHQVLRSDGSIAWTHSRAIPILDEAGQIVEWFGSASDVTSRKQAEAALRESEDRLRALVEGVPQLVWRASGTGYWTWASPQWLTYTGQTEAESLGRGWLSALHPDDRQSTTTSWTKADLNGGFDVEYRIYHVSEDRYRWFQTRATPVRSETGAIVEWLGTSTDVDDLRAMQERQKIMVAELQHRTRNLLGVVRSIAKQTIQTKDTMEAFESAFNSRLSALSRVQNLLSQPDDNLVTMTTLIRSELDALGALDMMDRVSIRGPEVRLPKGNVQTFALAVHELATNARKYGALANSTGRLVIGWEIAPGESETRLTLEWREEGIDPAHSTESPAKKAGYGRMLIERALPYALQARTEYHLSETSLRCTIDLPLPDQA